MSEERNHEVAVEARIAWLFVILLVVAGRVSSGSVSFLFHDFWFNAGLLLLILAVFVDQPFFSTESNVMLNGAAAAVSLIGVEDPIRNPVWYLMLVFSLWLTVSSYFLAYHRAGRLAGVSRTARFLSDLNRKLGRPQVVFSVLFLWGAATKFGLAGPKSSFLYIYWALFILFDFIGVARTFDRFLYRDDTAPKARLGKVRATIEPNLVEISLSGDSDITLGTHVDLLLKGTRVATGVLIDDRAMAGLRVGRLVLDSKEPGWTKAIAESPASVQIEKATADGADGRAGTFVGVAESGTEVAGIRTLVRPDCAIEEGSLLEVEYCEGKRAFYQVVGGKITDVTPEGDATYRSVGVIAEQLGFWTAKACFESVPWVVRANTPIYAVRNDVVPFETVPQGRIEVGHIPHSRFPIHVEMEDLVTHNAAILGVTGSGKSYLAFHLIDGLLKKSVRVLILDPSRQHFVFLKCHNPTAIKTLDELKAWLGSDSRLGIYQFADIKPTDAKTTFPAQTAAFICSVFETLTSRVELKLGETSPAQLCIVLEEAHSLIPEWNPVIVQADKDQVNRAARVLLQGRKFGIGVLVITQRTANVVKTILNQCNTVFALQCFDQTGLDFLKNYMGERYAQALSVLPRFHAVLVGKASSSARPVIFKVLDMSARWTPPAQAAELPVDQMPAEVATQHGDAAST